eukprot:s497_g33.t1
MGVVFSLVELSFGVTGSLVSLGSAICGLHTIASGSAVFFFAGLREVHDLQESLGKLSADFTSAAGTFLTKKGQARRETLSVNSPFLAADAWWFQVGPPPPQPSGVTNMEGIRTWMRLISPTDILERRAERAAYLQEVQAAARDAYIKEVRAEIAQNIKLTQERKMKRLNATFAAAQDATHDDIHDNMSRAKARNVKATGEKRVTFCFKLKL